MKKLVNQLISFINEDTPAKQAEKAGYMSLGGGYYSKTGKLPATATTRGGTFRLLTKKEIEARSRFPLPGRSTRTPDIEPELPPEQLKGVEEPSADVVVDTSREEASSDPRLNTLFGHKPNRAGRVSRMMALNAFKDTIMSRLNGDQKKAGQSLLSGLELLFRAMASGQEEIAYEMARALHKQFNFYSNTSGTTFKTQAFGMGERHFVGRTALARDLVEIFEKAGIGVRAAEDQDRGFKKSLDTASKPKLGKEFTFKKSKRVQQILSKFPQVQDKFKKLFGPAGEDGDLLDNTNGVNSRAYFEHSVQNNTSLERTAQTLEEGGFPEMAKTVKTHQDRMKQILADWDNYTPEERRKAVQQSYADMAVRLHSTKFGGDSEMCSAIMKNLAEVNLYDQELAEGKEVYLPAAGNFPAADKIVRVGGGTAAERIDKISVKYGKQGKIYGMPAQSSTIGLLHPDTFYHNLTGGRVGVKGYETGVRSDALETDNWNNLMEKSGYSKYITPKQSNALREDYTNLQKVIEAERAKIKPKVNRKTLALMMKDNKNIATVRERLSKTIGGLDLDKLAEHTGSEVTSLMKRSPLSFASILASHASIITAEGYPDLIHVHMNISDDDGNGKADLKFGEDRGSTALKNWHPMWREADERGGGLLLGYSEE